MSTFAKLSELHPVPIWNGVLGRTVEGDQLTMAVVELEPDSVVPQHEHHNEQIGVVLQGSLTFTIGGERRDLVAGDTYKIPGHVPHDVVTGPRGAVVIDVFAPVRADWGRFQPIAPQPPRWP